MPRFRPRSARACVAIASLASILAWHVGTPAARGENMLVSYEQAARHGLERAWFAQVPLDPSRSRASTWFLYFDRLYCVTDSGLVTALDAETGAKLWSQQVGRPGVAAFGPSANAANLGVVSGARLFMLDRERGTLKWTRELGGAPSSGPALSADYAYVAMTTGRIEGYRLDDPAVQPWYYQSKGRTHLRPTTTGRVVSWPTTDGYLYVSRADDPGVLYRLETSGDIVTSPAEMAPYMYIASEDGYLYCLHETSGREQWRYATGYPITSSPAIVGKHAYVASIEPVLHCVDSTTGAPLWAVRGASHFCAEGKQRVYASDRLGNLLVLDPKTGSLLGRMDTAEGFFTMVNDQTDRIFLVNDRGLVQCLREIGANAPTMYRSPTPLSDAAAAPPAEGTPESPFVEEEAAETDPLQEEAAPGEDPAADGEPGVEEPLDDAGEVEDEPAEDAPAEADVNPFEGL
ncbi:MAG TPA: PQQ-binding-like beta-propeller repeat protein [Lacipirellulaceae bacterium]|nr:PQQ-binding-like beta-propeller repeat protein [Lacipirellulaceae bacterium]